MNTQQRLFLVQAKSDFGVFVRLRRDPQIHACHTLHYLQMATEMLGKAHHWRGGPLRGSHKAFVGFLRSLTTNRQAQGDLGYGGQNENWAHLIRRSIPLADRIERLAPALTDGPNPEYPWPRDNPQAAPAEFTFDLWVELQETADGRHFIKLLSDLFRSAESFLRPS